MSFIKRQKHLITIQVVEEETDTILREEEFEGKTGDAIRYPSQDLITWFVAKGYELSAQWSGYHTVYSSRWSEKLPNDHEATSGRFGSAGEFSRGWESCLSRDKGESQVA